MSQQPQSIQPGMIVEVVQQIPYASQSWTSKTRGKVLKCYQKKTGSWYAHARHDKLWLDQLKLEKEDGEIIELSLDDYSHVEIISG